MIPSLEQGLGAPHEGALALARQEIQRGRPLLWRQDLHALTVRLPVAGPLVMDALDEVVAHDEIRNDRARMLAQRGRQDVLMQDLDQGPAFADAPESPLVELAQGHLEPWQRLHREVLGQRRVAVDEQPRAQGVDQGQGVEQSFG